MIDFEKQPLCATCPHCVGWAYPRGEQSCAEHMAYSEDGSCIYAAERAAQIKLDSYDDVYDTEDDDVYDTGEDYDCGTEDDA